MACRFSAKPGARTTSVAPAPGATIDREAAFAVGDGLPHGARRRAHRDGGADHHLTVRVLDHAGNARNGLREGQDQCQ